MPTCRALHRCAWGAAWVLALAAGCMPDAATDGRRVVTAPAPAAVRSFRLAAPDVVLLVTGGTEGVLEVCNCQGPTPGGLPRRGGLVASYRAAFPNVLLVDLGNSLWIEPHDLRNDFLWNAYARMGYDAVVLGTHEWAVPGDRLRALLNGADVTPLATTVASPGVAPVRAVTRTWPEARVAVLADVRPAALKFLPPARREQIHVAAPDDLARRVARAKRDGFVVVLLLHGPAEDVPAAAALGPDLIVRGHTKRSIPEVMDAGGTPVVQVGGQADVGALAMTCEDGRITGLEYRVERAGTRWPIDGRVEAVYQRYARTAMAAALDAPRMRGLDYVPSAECGRCHEKAHAAWRKSRHAHAWATLVEADRTMDPKCVACHTTGFGTAKGFYTIETTPGMANVNCQDCHRLTVDGHQKPGWRPEPITADVCTRCHTSVTDPHFAFAPRREALGCPSQTSSHAEER